MLSRLYALIILGFGGYLHAQASLLSNQSSRPTLLALNPRTLTYSGVPAPSGAVWSELSSEPMPNLFANAIAGVGMSANWPGSPTSRVADDFRVSNGHFLVTSIKTCAYRFGSTIPNPVFLDGAATIVDGIPSSNPNLIASAQLTSMSDSINFDLGSGIELRSVFRIFHSEIPAPGNPPNTSRKLWEIRYDFQTPVDLAAGDYWVLFQANTELPQTASSAFIPTTTHAGSRTPPTLGNALHQSGPLWQPIVDPGSPPEGPDIPQDLPFVVEGGWQRWPESYFVTSGVLFAGGLADLNESDGQYVHILCDESEPSGALRFEATAPLESVSRIDVQVECGSSRTDQTLFLEVWNRVTVKWENIATTTVTLEDSVTNGTLAAPLAYLGAENLVQARLQFVPTIDLFADDGWSDRVDRASVIYYP